MERRQKFNAAMERLETAAAAITPSIDLRSAMDETHRYNNPYEKDGENSWDAVFRFIHECEDSSLLDPYLISVWLFLSDHPFDEFRRIINTNYEDYMEGRRWKPTNK